MSHVAFPNECGTRGTVFVQCLAKNVASIGVRAQVSSCFANGVKIIRIIILMKLFSQSDDSIVVQHYDSRKK